MNDYDKYAILQLGCFRHTYELYSRAESALFYGTFSIRNMLPSHLAFRLDSLQQGQTRTHTHTYSVARARIGANKRGENLWLLTWYGAQTHPKRLSVDSISTMCTNNLQTEKLDEEKWKCVAASGSGPTHTQNTQDTQSPARQSGKYHINCIRLIYVAERIS